MPRDTTAATAPEGYQRPHPLKPGLLVVAVGEDGSDRGTWNFARLPATEPVREALAGAFADAVDVGGAWRSTATIRNGYNSVNAFLRWLRDEGSRLDTLADLTAATWNEYKLAVPLSVRAGRLGQLSTLLLATGDLRGDAATAVSRRSFRYDSGVQRSLTDPHVRAIRRMGHQIVDAAHQRISSNRALLARYRAGQCDPGTPDADLAEVLDILDRTGNLPRTGAGNQLLRAHARALGSASLRAALERLFLSATEAGAILALLASYDGWNPDVLYRLSLDDIDRADSHDDASKVFNVALDKPRRGASRHDRNTLVDTGPRSAARVLAMALELSAPARAALAAQGVVEDSFLVHVRRGVQGGGRRTLTSPVGDTAAGTTPHNVGRACVKLFESRVDLCDAEGDSVHWTLGTLRRYSTTQQHPQGHTTATNANDYMLRDSRVREESKAVIEAGLQAALVAVRATVVTGPVHDALPELSPDRAAQLERGDLDSTVAACRDVEHSPLNDNRLCDVSFLLCFACTNAVVLPRHLPRLVYLHRRLDRLRSSTPDELWARRWGAHWARLNHLLEHKFTVEECATAAEAITEQDRADIDATLERKYDE